MAGYYAICPFCGFLSDDFAKCNRCKRKLPPNVKMQPVDNADKKKMAVSHNFLIIWVGLNILLREYD